MDRVSTADSFLGAGREGNGQETGPAGGNWGGRLGTTPGGLLAGGRKAGINHPFPWLLSAFSLQYYHRTAKQKGCRVYRSAPDFEGTRVIYFGKSPVVLSSGALTGALRCVADAEACGQHAAGLLRPPCLYQAMLPLKAPNQNKTGVLCLLGWFGFF